MGVPIQQSAAVLPVSVMPERRRHERQCMRTPLQIVRVGEELAAIEGVCTDVSAGGLGFNTRAQLRVGEVIELEFVNADHGGLTFEARVLYRSGEHYGAYFLRSS